MNHWLDKDHGIDSSLRRFTAAGNHIPTAHAFIRNDRADREMICCLFHFRVEILSFTHFTCGILQWFTSPQRSVQYDLNYGRSISFHDSLWKLLFYFSHGADGMWFITSCFRSQSSDRLRSLPMSQIVSSVSELYKPLSKAPLSIRSLCQSKINLILAPSSFFSSSKTLGHRTAGERSSETRAGSRGFAECYQRRLRAKKKGLERNAAEGKKWRGEKK